jgi:hypothetical protein
VKMEKKELVRYGIGEWYGNLFKQISSAERVRLSEIRNLKSEPCPHRKDIELCNKNGGVCTLAAYKLADDKTGIMDIQNSGLVTLCPNRFWQNHTIFKAIGKELLNDEKPILIKEVNFLQRIDFEGNLSREFVGKIDLILTKNDHQNKILNWCAIELQAVYFSGMAMGPEFNEIRKQPHIIPYPKKIRRPDFRSSGPKRLMPQLEIKVPTLRRWGKKIAIVIDKPFFESIAKMKTVDSLSNADIAWFVVDYSGPNNSLNIYKTAYTTLESSIEGLTAGRPISITAFEDILLNYLLGKKDKLIRLFD